MRLFNFLITFLLSPLLVYSQSGLQVDSMIREVKISKDDTLKVKTLLRISMHYGFNDAEKSLRYANAALNLSQKLNWQKGIAASYFRIAYAYDNMGKFSEALKYRLSEVEAWKKQGHDINTCRALGSVGVSYSDQGNNLKALEYYHLALSMAEKINHPEGIINNLCNIASAYKDERNLVKAHEYYTKALKVAIDSKDERGISTVKGNLGNLYADQNKFGLALTLYIDALEIDEKRGDKRNISAWLANIGNLYQLQGDSARKAGNIPLSKQNNSTALTYFFRGLKITQELGHQYFEAYALGNIGSLYILESDFIAAEENLQRSLDIASAIEATDIVMDDHQRFYELYKKQNLPDKALKHLETFQAMKDSSQNAINRKNITELQVKFDTERKENENKSLMQKSQLQELQIKSDRAMLLAMVALFIGVLGVGVLIIRQNRLNTKRLAAQFEQKLLRTQMNPHFIFNSLASIESFIYDHEPKEAGVYLASFSKLMRLILENSASEQISLGKEKEILDYYLSLQKLRLDDNLDYSINIDNELLPDQVYLPPMLAQPFIENAIEHGFRGSEKKGEIRVNFNKMEEDLQIEIIDNGIGIKKAQQQEAMHKEHKSLALQITRERLKYLNKSRKGKVIFKIEDLASESSNLTGTKVTFLIPLS